MKDTFEFKVEMPLKKPEVDEAYQVVHVHARYPHIVYYIQVDPGGKKNGTKEQIDQAIRDLKANLIRQIRNAKWVYGVGDELYRSV
jgi:hypothetical protein